MSCNALAMVSLPELLLAVVSTAASVGLMLAIVALMQKLPSHPKAPCIAGGSADLAVVSPGVYRCRTCGYEGGEHLGKMEPVRRGLAPARLEWPVLNTERAFHALFVQIQAIAAKISDTAARVPGLTVSVFPEVGLEATQPRDGVQAFERTRAAMTVALGAVETLAAAEPPAGSDAAPTDAAPEVDPA